MLIYTIKWVNSRMLDIKKIRNSPNEILKFLNRKDKNIFIR